MTRISATNNVNEGFSITVGARPIITQATASNNKRGFYLAGDAVAPVITFSTITNNIENGVVIWGGAVVDPNPTINRSNLYGNGQRDVSLNVNFGSSFVNPNARLNFRENWWGTTDTNVINSKIYDHFDGAGLPYVDYGPPLDGEGGNPLPGTYVGGTLTENTTWVLTGSPFIVYQGVTIPPTITLTIEPGVSVRFTGTYVLTTNGILNAQGTSLAPITFTPNWPTPSPGSWGNISLIGSESSASQIAYCTIEYARTGLMLNGSSPTITEVAVSNCAISGFDLENASPTMTGITATLNGGYGIRISLNSSPTITYSTITNNTSYGIFIDHAGPNPDPNPTVNRSSLYGNGGVYDVGLGGSYLNPNAHLNFKENWWGTVDINTINLRLFDHYDNANVPFLDYLPILESEGGDPLFSIYDVSVSPEVINPSVGESSTISYSLTHDAAVTINLYDDLTKNLVKTLISGVPKTAGVHAEVWDGRDGSNAPAPQDAYYFTIFADDGLGRTVTFNDPAIPLTSPFFPVISNVSVDATNFDPYQNDLVGIHHTLDRHARVKFEILDGASATIRTAVNFDEFRLSGMNTDHWDGRKDDGSFYAGTFNVRSSLQSLPSPAILVHYPPLIDFDSFRTEAYLILPLFDEVSTVTYTLNRNANVTLEIQDPNGNHFKTLADNIPQPAGSYSFEWGGTNDNGEVASLEGAYRILLIAIDTVTGKMVERVGTTVIYQ